MKSCTAAHVAVDTQSKCERTRLDLPGYPAMKNWALAGDKLQAQLESRDVAQPDPGLVFAESWIRD